MRVYVVPTTIKIRLCIGAMDPQGQPTIIH